MEEIAQLERAYFLFRFGFGDSGACVDWAVERLLRDEEGKDLEIVLLAGAIKQEEVAPLVETIIARYSGASALDAQFLAGKYVALLRGAYLKGKESIESLDKKLWKVSSDLADPDWLVMLCRNCEYATDTSEFEEPFEKEFSYIAGLWDSAASRAEFEARYRRAVSDQHDVKNSRGGG